MFKFKTEPEMIVAVLHDVVEDSDITIKDLQKCGFSSSILEAISLLTKENNDDYKTFISKIIKNNLARKVKIEDLKDNLDITRLKNITEKDVERIKKYHESLQFLQRVKLY